MLAIGYQDADGRAIVARVLNQGQPTPFDPRLAVERFVDVLKNYQITRVVGDAYAGQTFKADFESRGIHYETAPLPTSKLYEALEPLLNGGRVLLPNVPELEQQLLGLIWRGGKIDHPGGEHDDYACVAAGLVHLLLGEQDVPIMLWGGGITPPDLPPQEGDALSRIKARRVSLAADAGESLLSAPEEAIARRGIYWPGD